MSDKSPLPGAQALATNFQVAELEPRLENAWADVEHSEPDCLKTNSCVEQL